MEFPVPLAFDSFPFHNLLRPLYSYLLSRKLYKTYMVSDKVCGWLMYLAVYLFTKDESFPKMRQVVDALNVGIKERKMRKIL